MDKNIYVVKPSLCSLREFMEQLSPAWESGVLTHNGPLVQKLEKDICSFLRLKNYVSVVNGTMALQLALNYFRDKTSNKRREVIIPSFTWAATATAVKYEGLVPIACDIDPDTYNMDPNHLERHINENTLAIMPVHVFGQPVDISAVEIIAQRFGVPVIYDAAHAFGAKFGGQSVLNYGHVSCVSTHATKIFNTGEGGGIISNKQSADFFAQSRFFGFDREGDICRSGTNAKMTEIHAALGIANMQYISEVLRRRKEVSGRYKQNLSGTDLKFQKTTDGSNHSYFSILFNDESKLLNIDKILKENGVYSRRYFYPSLEKFAYFDLKKCEIGSDISRRILCLPSYTNLTDDDIDRICNLLQ